MVPFVPIGHGKIGMMPTPVVDTVRHDADHVGNSLSRVYSTLASVVGGHHPWWAQRNIDSQSLIHQFTEDGAKVVDPASAPLFSATAYQGIIPNVPATPSHAIEAATLTSGTWIYFWVSPSPM